LCPLYFQAVDWNPDEELKVCSPRLLVIEHDDGIGEACVLAFDMLLQCTGSGDLCNRLTDFIACYYVWDIRYPKQYQILGLLQLELLQDHKSRFSRVQILSNF
jgi:hypothetical protein